MQEDKDKNNQATSNLSFTYKFNKSLFEEFPALKWITIILLLFLIIYLSRFVFKAIAASVEGYKDMKAAFQDKE
ncbi:MAG: hypothetical protein K2X86_14855 [Cytophagaceae bacterium]|nr:hypothetical protein [Cytophagaceae bacterium]